MTPPVVILASASPSRHAALRAAGIDALVRVSGIDEDAIMAGLKFASERTVLQALADAKVDAVLASVRAEFDHAVIIGCDSMFWFDGQLQGKPADASQARSRWLAMSGQTGELLTGHALRYVAADGQVVSAGRVCATTVHIGRPTEHELAAYISTGEPMKVAGALTIDGFGAWFVDGLDGDASNVVGISLPLIRQLLGEVGISVTDLWRQ